MSGDIQTGPEMKMTVHSRQRAAAGDFCTGNTDIAPDCGPYLTG